MESGLLNFEMMLAENAAGDGLVSRFGDGTPIIKITHRDFNCYEQISRDADGNFYFRVPNICRNPKVSMMRSFRYRIKDAIEMIRAGYGDALSVSNNVFSSTLGVVRYTNRQIGEARREECISSWEGVNFFYAISMDGFRVLRNNGDLTVYSESEENPDDIIHFSTYEEASNYIKDVYTRCREFVDNMSDEVSEVSYDRMLELYSKQNGSSDEIDQIMLAALYDDKYNGCDYNVEYMFDVRQMFS